LWAGNLLKL